MALHDSREGEAPSEPGGIVARREARPPKIVQRRLANPPLRRSESWRRFRNSGRTREIEYPSGDGKPMAETELHLLFDPTEDYLDPPLQGFRLAGELYVPIEPIAGRLPSQVLGLHLELAMARTFASSIPRRASTC